ncbi:MAG: hypothetical protein WD097_00295 [Balneolales bacterium]
MHSDHYFGISILLAFFLPLQESAANGPAFFPEAAEWRHSGGTAASEIMCPYELLDTGMEIREDTGRIAEVRFYESFREKCFPDSHFAGNLANRYLEASEALKNSDSRRERRWSSEWLHIAHDLALHATQEDDYNSFAFEMRAAIFAAMADRAPLYRMAALGDSVWAYAHKALERNEYNYEALYILGRWHYEVAGLPWIASSLRNLLTTGTQASNEKAVWYLERSVETKRQPDYVYWLGMAYKKLGRLDEARQCMQEVADADADSAWDPSLIENAARFLRDGLLH